MNAADFFAAADALPFGTLADLTGGGGLVVVAPHPDDESLGCGGLIAAACARGVAVRLIVVSDGVGSHAGSRRYPPPRLRALREAETYAAALELGLSRDAICFLGLPDSSVPHDGTAAEAARDVIVGAAKGCAAGVVCVTWNRDPHCDHVAAASLVVGCRSRLGQARVVFYPIWGWTLPLETDVGAPPRGMRFDIADHVDAKAAAIAAHRSQTTDLIDDDPNGFRLTSSILANFARPFEIFIDADAVPSP